MASTQQALNANDIVIALMGMTGSGKSTLVNLCTNQQVEIGHDLQSCTQDVRTYSFRHPRLPSGRVHLVDTPGFDDTNRTDTEVLRTVAAWLKETYSNGVKLSGILYLHRINQPRMQGSALKNLSLLRSLCGDDTLQKVVLVTTMWDITEASIAESRERQLKDTPKYWGSMVAKGSQVIRHDNTQTSAFALFEIFVKGDPKIILKIQREMVDDHKPLEITDAANDIKEMLAEHNATLNKKLQEIDSELREALRAKDEELAEAMKEMRLEHQKDLQQVVDEQKKWQVTMEQRHDLRITELEKKSKGKDKSNSPDTNFTSSANNIIKSSKQSDPSSISQPLGIRLDIRIKLVHEESFPEIISWPVRLSPDGSCLGVLIDGTKPKPALFSMQPCRVIEEYDMPGYRGTFEHAPWFYSNGQRIAVACTTGIYVARRGTSQLEPLRALDYDERTYCSTISTDLTTTAYMEGERYSDPINDTTLVLVSTTNRSRQTLQCDCTKHDYCAVIFAQLDQLLIYCCSTCIQFWDIRNSESQLSVNPICVHKFEHKEAASYSMSFLRCTKSGNSLWLAVTFRSDPRYGNNHRGETSFFRLSGPLPELINTIKYEILGFDSVGTGALSFDGTYFLVGTWRKIIIFHVATGRIVWREGMKRIHMLYGSDSRNWASGYMMFFPSDNRLLYYYRSGYSILQVED